MEDEKSLQPGALVGQLTHSIQNLVNQLFADCIVTTSVVVCSVFLSRYQLLWVEQLAVGASADLVHHGGFEINEHCARNMLASASLGEEGVEAVVTTADGLVARHLTVRLDAMLQAVQLPTPISDLGASLADMDGNALAHDCCCWIGWIG